MCTYLDMGKYENTYFKRNINENMMLIVLLFFLLLQMFFFVPNCNSNFVLFQKRRFKFQLD